MSKEKLQVGGLAEPTGVWSSAIVAEGRRTLYISGMVAEDAHGVIVGIGDVKEQTRQVLENMRRVLDAAGADFEHVVKVTVYVTDMAGWAEVHAIRREYFMPPYPASTLVEVSRLYRPELLVEIDAVAVLDYGSRE